MVLSNPPLNLFGDDAWGALVACIDEVEGSDARALVWRADGDIFTGGVDVNSFKRVQEEGSASDSFGSLIPVVQQARGAPDPDAGPGPRPLPDRGPRDLAGLRHDLGDRVGALRPGRGGRRPDARAPAARSGWPSGPGRRGPPSS